MASSFKKTLGQTPPPWLAQSPNTIPIRPGMKWTNRALAMAHEDHKSIEASLLAQLREEIHGRLGPRRHTALLVAIVAAFLVRPLIGDSGAGPPIFSLAMLVLLLLALYNINVDDLVGDRETLLAQSRRRSIIGWMLAVPAIVERFAIFLAPSHSLYLSGSILWLLLFAYITWNELRAVLKQKQITREVISMS